MGKAKRLAILCLTLLTAAATVGCVGTTSGSPKTTPSSRACHLQSVSRHGRPVMDCPVQITTTALPGGAVGVGYNAALTATNGEPPYTWGVVGGQLPPGLSLQASTGHILGTPAKVGAFSFQAQVMDITGDTTSSNFSINSGTASAPSVNAASPAYGSGFTSTALTLNGNAAINGTRLRLTDGATGEASSAFFNTPVNVQSFTNDFSFQLTNATADGFTFTIQGNKATLLGSGGGHLGYASPSGATPGIDKSVAVKFDLYNNAGEGNNSTGLYTNGAQPTIPAVDLTSSGVDLHSGDLMNVHMTYDGTTLVTQITDTATNATFRTSSPVNIPNTVGGNTAFVGFTGATGGLTAVQDIVNWTYASSGTSSSQPAGSPLQITTSALPGGAVGVSYNAALTAVNGLPPYTWSLLGGQLPPGLNLQPSNGQIAGTPTQAGAFTFQAQVKDSSGATASSSFSINTGTSSAPVVSRVSPNAGPTSGGTSVTLSGFNFHAGATVLFGGVSAASVVVNGATQIQAVTPAHVAGTVDVTVRNPDAQSSTLASGFVYNSAAPTVASVSPNTGSTRGGAGVTISGTNFLAGALVFFGAAQASSVVVNSPTQIQAVTPADTAGVVDVKVEDPGGQSGKLAGGFIYTSPTTPNPPPPPPPPGGSQSLLAGMTPASFTVPSGWTLVTTQDFESGSMPSGQYVVGAITTTNPHTGSRSVEGAYTGDGSDVRWGYSAGQIGSFSEIYISFYDFLESQGTMNDEMYQVHLEQRDSAGNLIQDIILDWFGGAVYNGKSGNIVWEPQSAGGGGITTAIYGPGLTPGWGAWTQWELEFKPNTSSGGVPHSDGLFRAYRNGTLVFQTTNFNTNGTVDMSGVKVEAGGVYTRLNWTVTQTNLTCTSGPGTGVGYDRCSRFPTCRCGPPTPSFRRYIDDVILLKKP